ncbi:PEP/pyruvate-binding domain-containing protein, partial [Neisseria sp. P0001.S004]
AFLAHNGLSERISEALKQLDVEDVAELARVGKEIRQWILNTPFPDQLDAEIETAWNKMVADAGGADISVAVRSSATAEDLPDASFAGQQETFLNINGLDNVKEAMHHVFASLYNDRAISYRVHKGFEHDIV